MGRHLGMAARRELVLAVGQGYKTTSVTKKRRTLDEFAGDPGTAQECGRCSFGIALAGTALR